MTTEAILIVLALGGVGGWYFGRSWAEDSRAEFDMNQTWDRRRNYRLPPDERK